MSQQIKITQTLIKGGQLIQPNDFARGSYDGTAPVNVVAASNDHVNLATVIPNSTLDGVTLALNDKVLLKNQDNPSANGVYDVTPTGAQMNAEAAQRFSERNVANVVVYAGATNGQTMWGNSTYVTTYNAGLFTPPLSFYPLVSGSTGTGTVTNVSVATANGFTGAVASPSTTPVISMGTDVTGILKGSGGAISAAVAGDFPIFNQDTTGNAATATNVLGGATNQLVYQTATSNTAFLPTASDGVLVTDSAGVPSISTALPAVDGSLVANINANNITSGAVSASVLPTGSASQRGVVQVDGTTIVADANGVISATTLGGTYTAGTGLALAANQFSIAPTIAAANNVGSASSVPVVSYNAQGQLTNAVNTPIAISATQVTSGALPIARGGTGQTTANTALNALLPTQGTSAGRFLTTNGANTSWAVPTIATIQGGAANTVVYQSAANVTSFMSAPTDAGSLITYDGTNIGWNSTPLVHLASNSTVVGVPTSANSLVNKAYVDSFANGITVKGPVIAVATSNVPLAGSTPLVIDSVTITNGAAVLLNGESSSVDNGIYVMSITGGTYTLTRRSDFAAGSTQAGASVYVQQGTVYAGTQWTNSGNGVVGTDATTFYQSAGVGTYTNGLGLSLNANQFSITPVVAAASNVGSANAVASVTYNAQGQITATHTLPIDIDMSQVSTGTLPITQGGTGATDANSALNALLPAQAGNVGYTLTTDGTNSSWAALPSYTAGTGLSFAAGQFSLSNTSVTVGTYGNVWSVPVITINAQGQITNAVNTPIAIDAAQVISGTVPIARGGTGQTTANAALNALLPSQLGQGGYYLTTDGTNTSWAVAAASYTAGAGLTLASNQFSITPTGVVAGSYGDASTVPALTINASGQIVSATATPIAINASQITSGVLPIGQGGTGATNATSALNALLPTQAGNNGYVLTTDGADSAWTAIPTYSAGAGITLTGGQFAITDTGVTIGTYGSASTAAVFTVDSRGQLTSATSTPIAIDAAQVVSGVVPISRGGTGAITANTALNALLPTQGASAGKYLSSNGTNATWATPTVDTVQGGVANTVLYQTATNTTAFMPAPTTANSLLSYDGTSMGWAATPFVNLANNSTVAGTPTTANAIANKAYVDSFANGITVKSPVQAIATTNIALTGSTPLVVDGVTLTDGGSILVNGETSAIDNGIYVVAITGGTYTLTRRSDFAAGTSQVGSSVYVQDGTVYAGTQWINSGAGLVGTAAITFYQSAGVGTYTNGTGLSLSANQFSITPVITAASNVGSASAVPSITYNAEGQITATNTVPISIDMAQVSTGVLPIAQGGTGATDANSALNALLPAQAGSANYVLTTDGSDSSWAAIPAYTAGTGLSLLDTQFSVSDTGVAVGTYGNGANVPTLAVNAQGQLTSVSNTPIAIDAAQVVSGTVPVSKGGTGANALATNAVLLGNGSSPVQTVAPGAVGNVLTSALVGGVPTWVSSSGSSQAQYASYYNAVNQTGVVIGSQILFPTQASRIGSAISINATTGTITLQPGFTYRLRAVLGRIVAASGAPSGAACVYQWRNLTTNAFISGSSGINLSPSRAETSAFSGNAVEVTLAPTVVTQVAVVVAYIDQSTNTISNADYPSWLEIEAVSGLLPVTTSTYNGAAVCPFTVDTALSTSQSTATIVLSFNLPAAGVYQLHGLVPIINTGGVQMNSYVGLWDSAGTFVPYSQVEATWESNTANKSTTTPIYQVNASAAGVYTIRAWCDHAVASAGYSDSTGYTQGGYTMISQNAGILGIPTTITSPTNGQYLTYQSSSGTWVNSNSTGAPVTYYGNVTCPLADGTVITGTTASNAMTVLSYPIPVAGVFEINAMVISNVSVSNNSYTEFALYDPSGTIVAGTNIIGAWQPVNANVATATGTWQITAAYAGTYTVKIWSSGAGSIKNGTTYGYTQGNYAMVSSGALITGIPSNITTPSQGQYLTYDSASSKWINTNSVGSTLTYYGSGANYCANGSFVPTAGNTPLTIGTVTLPVVGTYRISLNANNLGSGGGQSQILASLYYGGAQVPGTIIGNSYLGQLNSYQSNITGDWHITTTVPNAVYSVCVISNSATYNGGTIQNANNQGVPSIIWECLSTGSLVQGFNSTIAAPTDGQVLIYQASSGTWVNGNVNISNGVPNWTDAGTIQDVGIAATGGVAPTIPTTTQSNRIY